MSWKDKIKTKVLNAFSSKELITEAAMRRGMPKGETKLSGKLKNEAKIPRVFDLQDWRMAVTMATDPERPDRSRLMKIYESCELDDHLMTAIENIWLDLQGSTFKTLDKSKKENEAVALLRKPWFMDFIKFYIMHFFTGTKVVEMFDLNEKGELEEITLIPETHVNPHKKLILDESNDRDKGSNYAEGPISNYYIQIGKNKDLGVMEKLAVAILFKKMAVGSWLDHIEKYGVPPRWVITDREDDERLDELYDMMKDMISNHFAVLRGQEKIEIMPTPGTDAHKVFEHFIDKMENGVTKRVLGASGTVDEKAFVGGAKIHQDTYKKRILAYKFLFQYCVNEFLIPRLLKISSAYAPLANLTFTFDETEQLTKKELVDVITQLATEFILDPEEISQKTGFTILGQKQNNTVVPDGEKKKPVAK